MQAYGGKCVCCGEDELDFLVIDHINDNGAEHRKEVNLRVIYRWLWKNNLPEGFQVLCANCNLSKQIRRSYDGLGYCIHQRRIFEELPMETLNG